MTRPSKLLLAFFFMLSATSALARKKKDSLGPAIPETTVEQFRIESNYGPEDAIMNPAFPRDGKWEFSGGFAISPFSSLVHYTGYTGNLTIHLNRRHAIEPLYFASNKSELTSFVKTQIRDQLSDPTVLSSNGIEMPKYTFAASYLFSPYYSKMHITERTVVHFDVFTGIGFGILRNQPVALNGTLTKTIDRPAGLATLGMRFLLPPRFALRLELRDFIHTMKNFEDRFTGNTLQISLSTSLFFGAFPD